METYIQKAAVLIEALPYIQSFRDKTVVIKFGGSTMGDEILLNSILKDIVFMECVGINPVVIHGGGPKISSRMKQENMEPKFIQGQRITSKASIDLVVEVLSEINKEIVEKIEAYGGKAQGVFGNTDKLIQCIKHPPIHIKDENGEEKEVDVGFVGDIVNVNVQPIRALTKRRKVAVLSPFGIDNNGDLYNINADKVAGQIASQLKAEKLVFLSNVHGILKSLDDPESYFSTISSAEVEKLIKDKIIVDGMVPKIDSCLKAVENGVGKTHIIDGGMMHSLLLEIFTDKGIGTQIIA